MTRVRAVFISDVHLGTRACQADSLLEFLREYESDHVYLLGDIVDFWAMNRSIQWAASHNTVVQKVLRRARHGAQVIFVPGNHDEALREYVGESFGDIRVESEWIHVAADGRRYWLIHGDQYDQVTRHHRWVALLGDVAYNALVRINLLISRVRRLLRRPGYWSRLRQAEGQEGREFHFRFRGCDCPRDPPTRTRWRDLRAHPLASRPGGRWCALSELRRLGRYLQRHHRAS